MTPHRILLAALVALAGPANAADVFVQTVQVGVSPLQDAAERLQTAVIELSDITDSVRAAR